MTINLGAQSRLLLAGLSESWPWLAAGLAALALLLVLYRYERRLVSPGMGLLLLGLRLLAALALLTAMGEPILVREQTETLRGRLIVGVDLSQSMDTLDRQRDSQERDTLNRLLNLSTDQPAGSLSRQQIARRLLAGPWLDELERVHQVEIHGFARGLMPASREMLTATEKAAKPQSTDDTLATDWEPVLSQALGARQTDQPVVGVVLLSDGRNNMPGAEPTALQRLVEDRVPIFPVLIGSTQAPTDVAIAGLQAPETVDKGQVARVDVTIKADGLPPGTEIPVRLEQPGQPALEQVTRAQADGGRPTASFRVPMGEPGEVELKVSVGPVEGDIQPANDQKITRVFVADDQARVLLVDTQPRWEFQYLRNLLVRDPRVTLEAVVLNQPGLGDGRANRFYQQALPALPDSPEEADPLGGFDVVILGDLKEDDLSPRDWERLSWYVAERGGALVLSAGPRGGSAGASSLQDLLPVLDLVVMPVDPASIDPKRPNLPAGRALLPTPMAAVASAWPMLRLAEEPPASQQLWANLPRQPWVQGGRAKPTATALAVSRMVNPVDEERLTSLASEPGPEDDTVAMAAMPYGLGKVLWIGTNGTWRWRFGVGDATHHRFWGQVVQWGARNKLTAGNRLVQFGADPPRVVEGQPAKVRARFTEAAGMLQPVMLVAARVLKAEEKAESAPTPNSTSQETVALARLQASPGQPRSFEAALPTLPPGRYTVILEVPEMQAEFDVEGPTPQAALEVTPRETTELVELAATADELQRLATATGGALVRDFQFDTLPGLLDNRKAVRTRVESNRLWDRPEPLLLFVALLSVEWLVRKKAGLP